MMGSVNLNREDFLNKFGGRLQDNFHVLDTFTPEDAAEIADQVLVLEDEWTDRGFFHTLGASAYIDTPAQYQANTPHGNDVLSEYFQEPLTTLFQTFGQFAKRNTGPLENPHGHPDAQAALPGFHIVGNKANGRSGMFHVDMPYQRVYWPGPFMHPFTFTTLIATPAVGAGLWYWDDMPLERGMEIIEATHNDSRTAHSTPEEGRSFLAYEVGKTYIYSGRVPHAIANVGDIDPDEYRITLQGHGAYLPEDDYIALYF